MDWSGRRVLVTGAGGFLGSHLVESLVRAGAEVTGLVRYSSRPDWGNLECLDPGLLREIRVTKGNVEDPAFVSRQVKGKDCVFHLAALIAIPHSYAAPLSYLRTNVEGTVHLLNAALEHGVSRFVHTSTSEVYGSARYVPIDENHPLQAQSPYAASKTAADKMVESYHCAYGLPVSILRPFNAFGPRQSARAFLPSLIAQALLGKEIRVGSLSPKRDLTYVEDIVRAFLAIGSSDEAIGRTIHVGTGEAISIGELARKVLARLGSEARLIEDEARRRPEKSEVQTLVCDPTLAKRILGWAPRHSLEEGLGETIRFVRDNPSRFAPERYQT